MASQGASTLDSAPPLPPAASVPLKPLASFNLDPNQLGTDLHALSSGPDGINKSDKSRNSRNGTVPGSGPSVLRRVVYSALFTRNLGEIITEWHPDPTLRAQGFVMDYDTEIVFIVRQKQKATAHLNATGELVPDQWIDRGPPQQIEASRRRKVIATRQIPLTSPSAPPALSVAPLPIPAPTSEIPWKFTYLPEPQLHDLRLKNRNFSPSKSLEEFWSAFYVKFPSSSRNRYCLASDPSKTLPKWDLIIASLRSMPIQTSKQLELAIRRYNPTYASFWGPFDGLRSLEHAEPRFIADTLPYIIGMALQLPDYFSAAIPPVLRRQQTGSILLSQKQCVSLLANMFLCTFPRCPPHKWHGKAKEYEGFANVGFDGLFTNSAPSSVAKLRCLIAYFNYHHDHPHVDGDVLFRRQNVSGNEIPDWKNCDCPLVPFDVVPRSGIENMTGAWQADFANKCIGGGVLGQGSVQEEIRFAISPELIVSRLFMQEMAPNEAIVIYGSQRYASYTGYSKSFSFAGPYEDEFVLKGGKTFVVALDALNYDSLDPLIQFSAEDTNRELEKAFAAFRPATEEEKMPVATGRWGCGAFQGNPYWKFLIQLLATSANGRTMQFCTLDSASLHNTLLQFKEFVDAFPIQISVAALYRVMSACVPASADENVLPFVMQQLTAWHQQQQQAQDTQSSSNGAPETRLVQLPPLGRRHDLVYAPIGQSDSSGSSQQFPRFVLPAPSDGSSESLGLYPASTSSFADFSSPSYSSSGTLHAIPEPQTSMPLGSEEPFTLPPLSGEMPPMLLGANSTATAPPPGLISTPLQISDLPLLLTLPPGDTDPDPTSHHLGINAQNAHRCILQPLSNPHPRSSTPEPAAPRILPPLSFQGK